MRSHDHGAPRVIDWLGLHKKSWRYIDFKDDFQRTIGPLKTTRYSLALRSNRYHESVCPRSSNTISHYGDAQNHVMKVLQPETVGVDYVFKAIRQYDITTPIATAPPQPPQAGNAPLPQPPPPRSPKPPPPRPKRQIQDERGRRATTTRRLHRRLRRRRNHPQGRGLHQRAEATTASIKRRERK